MRRLIILIFTLFPLILSAQAPVILSQPYNFQKYVLIQKYLQVGDTVSADSIRIGTKFFSPYWWTRFNNKVAFADTGTVGKIDTKYQRTIALNSYQKKSDTATYDASKYYVALLLNSYMKYTDTLSTGNIASKKYVADHSGSTYTASNGLTMVGNDFQLGGSNLINGIEITEPINDFGFQIYKPSSTSWASYLSGGSMTNNMLSGIATDTSFLTFQASGKVNSIYARFDTTGFNYHTNLPDTSKMGDWHLMPKIWIKDQIYANSGGSLIEINDNLLGGSGTSNLGQYNTVFGINAGHSLNGATKNVLVGHGAGYSLNYGYYSGQSDNTFIGYNSGYYTTNSAYSNTFVGNVSGHNNVDGTNNTYLGYRAGYTCLGNGNIFIGSQSGDTVTNINNTLLIGSATPIITGDLITGRVTFTDQIKTKQLTGALTDGMPTATQINAATSLTPSTAGAGYTATIHDTDGTQLDYRIYSNGTTWSYWIGTMAL